MARSPRAGRRAGVADDENGVAVRAGRTDGRAIGTRFRVGVAGVLVALNLAACGSSPVPASPAAPQSVGPSPSASALGTPSSMPSPSASLVTAACPRVADGVFPHQAPELEAALPPTVGGRSLTRWSVRGRCWLELTFDDPTVAAQFIAPFTTAANPNPVDDAALVYAIAGRAVDSDPPYFVLAAVRPTNEDEIGLVLALVFGGAGFKDVEASTDLSHYRKQTVGDKEVDVGTAEMLRQSTHQRGRPYLYETDQYLFLIITDDDAWATEAIGQLP